MPDQFVSRTPSLVATSLSTTTTRPMACHQHGKAISNDKDKCQGTVNSGPTRRYGTKQQGGGTRVSSSLAGTNHYSKLWTCRTHGSWTNMATICSAISKGTRILECMRIITTFYFYGASRSLLLVARIKTSWKGNLSKLTEIECFVSSEKTVCSEKNTSPNGFLSDCWSRSAYTAHVLP